MNGSDLEVALCLARGVRAEKQSVDGVGLVRGPRERAIRGRSLEQTSTHDSLSGPVQRVRDDQVTQIRRVLLPGSEKYVLSRWMVRFGNGLADLVLYSCDSKASQISALS